MPFGHIQWLASEVRVASASLELHSPESRSLTLFVQRRLVLTILSARDNVATAWPFLAGRALRLPALLVSKRSLGKLARFVKVC